MPSAVSEPLWALHLWMKKKQAIVTEEGGAVHSINLCKHCNNESEVIKANNQ